MSLPKRDQSPERHEVVGPRFWARVEWSEGCWEWLGPRGRGGYGCYTQLGESYAHRVAYRLAVGPVPKGLEIDHLCRNRGCVNPAHLEPVTHRANILRSPIALPAIRARLTHCPKGHPYAGANLMVSGGSRYCRICHRAAWRRSMAKRRAA